MTMPTWPPTFTWANTLKSPLEAVAAGSATGRSMSDGVDLLRLERGEQLGGVVVGVVLL